MKRAEAPDTTQVETMITRIAVVLLFGALALAPTLSIAADDALEQFAIEAADSPAEHAALAQHYRAKAEEARAAMQTHERMGPAYVRGKSQHRNQMRTHCKNLSQKYSAIAEEYEALAKLHEEAGKEAQ